MLTIKTQFVTDMLAQLIGIEGAERLLNAAIVDAGLTWKIFYTEPELKAVCSRLARHGGAIRLFAELITTSEYRERQYQRLLDRDRRDREETASFYRKLEELNAELLVSNDKLREANEDLQRMQEELLRNERMAAIGRLASGVAHELRNPLTGILNVQYYLKRYLASEDPRLTEFLELSGKEIERANRIITELLDFSETKGYLTEDVPLAGVIDEVLQESCGDGRVDVVTRFPPEPVVVRADRKRMKQVFGHIVANALDAMRGRGTLTVTATASGERIGISFADTGCGMPSEVMENLFEPLFTTKTRGIGLGMPLVKSVVEAHGGALRVASEEGTGTTFTVDLPTAPGPPDGEGVTSPRTQPEDTDR